jgi:hypothetical protein
MSSREQSADSSESRRPVVFPFGSFARLGDELSATKTKSNKHAPYNNKKKKKGSVCVRAKKKYQAVCQNKGKRTLS